MTRPDAGDAALGHAVPPTPQDIEARWAALVDASPDALIGVDLAGTITSWNRSAMALLGFRAAEIVGQRITLLVSPERAGEIEPLLQRSRSGQRVGGHQTIFVGQDGTKTDVALTVFPVTNRGGAVAEITILARDISEHKHAKEQAAQMSIAIEAAPNGMVMVDGGGAIRMVNSQMERLFGYSREEMLGQPIEMLLPNRYRQAHPAQREAYTRIPEVRAMGHGRDLFGRRKDGSEFPVEVGLNPAKTPEGMFVLAAVIDITQRKRMEGELEKVHEELRLHADQLEATVAERTAHLEHTIRELEAVSYSLSHDLRAPIRTIQGFAQLILEDAGERLTDEEKDMLRKSISAANRLDHLIRDVLTYTRVSQQELRLHPVDVEKLVRQIIDERPELQPPKATIEIISPLLPVQGHEASLTQVITNLLDNAVKFVAPGRSPAIRIWSEDRRGSLVNLYFEDNGIGIPREAQERLFAIFQRVHDENRYAGTGIGLAIVRKAVERMGGTVRVESESGQGSRFCVELPRAKK